jgi:glycosyltransferase involved in cell wall biosynthesis
MSITAHTIIKNEENFISYAIKSVVDFVDKIIVFDTGSTDKTMEIVQKLAEEYPDKIIFEEKGDCDKKRHTELRQEMVDRTITEWFMILDGDEVWTKRGMEEVLKIINENPSAECLVAPFYLCVGDVYHRYYKNGDYEMLDRKDYFSPRIIKKIKGIRWSGDYNNDVLIFADGRVIFQKENTIFLKNKYWHLTHLKRSSKDNNDFSSYGTRKNKRRNTYFIIGSKIKEPIPEVLMNCCKLSFMPSLINFFDLLLVKIWVKKIK